MPLLLSLPDGTAGYAMQVWSVAPPMRERLSSGSGYAKSGLGMLQLIRRCLLRL
jgi:hypothetical protein